MKAAAVTRIAKAIEQKHGRCDILVNNAGLNILDAAGPSSRRPAPSR